MLLTKKALISASALSGVSVASVLTLITLESSSHYKSASLLLFSIAIPLLSSCIILNTEDPDHQRDRTPVSSLFFGAGSLAAVAGFTALIAHVSPPIGAAFFLVSCLSMVVAGNAHIKSNRDAT